MAKGRRINVRLDKGWKDYVRAVDHKEFRRRFNAKRKFAIKKAARKIVMETIDLNGYAPNAPLTIMLKGRDAPLQDTGKKLLKSIDYKMLGNREMFVGIKKGRKIYPAAVAIHEGADIQVSDKMRNMFSMLWMAAQGKIKTKSLKGRARQLWRISKRQGKQKEWRPLSEGTSEINIPGRPFFDDAFSSKEAQKIALLEFERVVDRIFRRMTQGAQKPKRR